VSEPSRTLFVGDVHGCADELARLLDAARADAVVLVGDLYTKGPDPVGVWRLIRDRGLQAVRGNHDERLVKVLAGKRADDDHGCSVIRQLDAADPAWRDHLHALPLWLEVAGWTVVHASVHPSGDLQQTTRNDCLVRRRWPRKKKNAKRWWRTYEGDRRVVYGHDAVEGRVVVRRDGRLHLAGLDTGCVYGGALTGLLVPDEVFVEVPAAQVYRPVG